MRRPEDITTEAPFIATSICEGVTDSTAVLARARGPPAASFSVRRAFRAAWVACTSSSRRWMRIEGMSMATGQTS